MMNERLMEYFDFKKHFLKSSVFFFILLILNTFMWNLFINESNLPFYVPIIFVVATFFLVYTLLTRAKYKLKDENWTKYILKVDGEAAIWLFLIYLIFFPLVFGFYLLINMIIDSLKNIPSTTLEIILIISGVVIGVVLAILIMGLIQFVIAKLNAKEIEDNKEQSKQSNEIPTPVFTDMEEEMPKVKLETYDMEESVKQPKLLPKKEQGRLFKNLKKKVKK